MWVLLSLQFLAQTFIPDVPEEVEIQQKRNAFIISKIIEKTPDETPMKVRDYQNSTRSAQMSASGRDAEGGVEEEKDEEPQVTGLLACCLRTVEGHTYMKKHNYSGCPDIATDYYPKQATTGGAAAVNDNRMTNNPMNNL
jgi:hypothetical protein